MSSASALPRLLRHAAAATCHGGALTAAAAGSCLLPTGTSAAALRCSAASCSSSIQQALQLQHHRPSLAPGHAVRSYSAQPQPSPAGADGQDSLPGNDKVRKLAEEIVGLSVLECSWLSEILRKKLNMQKPAYGAMPAFAAMPAAAPAAAAAAPAEKKEEKKEKTEFDVKLESFSAEGKIKVIKEVRTMTNLGLKEAKELVSTGSAPLSRSVAASCARPRRRCCKLAAQHAGAELHMPGA